MISSYYARNIWELGVVTRIIRRMNKKDMKQIQDIAKTTWHATYDGIIPRDIQDHFLEKAYSLQMMKQRLKQPYFFVAEVKGRSEERRVGKECRSRWEPGEENKRRGDSGAKDD